jgi:hypothetical protein
MKKKAKETLGLLSTLKYWRFLCFKRSKSEIQLLVSGMTIYQIVGI